MAPNQEVDVAVLANRVDTLEENSKENTKAIFKKLDIIGTSVTELVIIGRGLKETLGEHAKNLEIHNQKIAELQMHQAKTKTSIKMLIIALVGSGTLGASVATLLQKIIGY